MARSVLEIVQAAAPKLGIAVPSALFSATDRTEVELRSILNEVAERIVRAHDWSALKTLETNTGDGVTVGFSLPSDYVRMPKDGQIWSSRWQNPLTPVSSDEWLMLDVQDYDLVTGAWIILGGQIQFNPPLTATETAKWFYVSGNYAVPVSGANKSAFSADDDTFILDDRLLELMLIWEYRQRKGLDYAEDLANAEVALGQQISEDRGARIISQRSRAGARGAFAYPLNVTP